jgi:Flp pilus assembly protein TadG
MTMKLLSSKWRRIRRFAVRLAADSRGVAAVEFAMIIPVMLVLFYGTDEFASGVAVDRKVTLMARTLADLTSQSSTVTDTQLTNFFNASKGIMTPYASITELYIDPTTKAARVQWSKGTSPRTAGTTVAIPAALQVGGTYLIYSEVNYNYVPTIGYIMAKTGVTLSDFTFTRPRQSTCVMYATAVCTTT